MLNTTTPKINKGGTVYRSIMSPESTIDIQQVKSFKVEGGLLKYTLDDNAYITVFDESKFLKLKDNSELPTGLNQVLSIDPISGDLEKAPVLSIGNTSIEKAVAYFENGVLGSEINPVNENDFTRKNWVDKHKLNKDEISTLSSVRTTNQLYSGKFVYKAWVGLSSILGRNVWVDNNNIYYSFNSQQYVLDQDDNTWVAKEWVGLTEFNGENIWTDGVDIYHSNGSVHHVLNKSNSTWVIKEWAGLSNFSGRFIWTDGVDIYHSSPDRPSAQQLSVSESTWNTIFFNLSNVDGSNIWTTGIAIYYGTGSNQYVWNSDNKTWVIKEWNGLNPLGYCVWTDGVNIYHSNGSFHHVLNKSNNTWAVKEWGTVNDFFGRDVWRYKGNTYCGGYVLTKPIRLN